MAENTGNVWRDPDTGKPANPQNILIGDYYGRPIIERHGPAITGRPRGTPPAAAEAVVTTPVPPAVGPGIGPEMPEAPPAGAAYAFGAAVEGVAVAPEVSQRLAELRTLRQESTKAKTAPARRAAAAALQTLATEEFARETPRPDVLRRLKSYGLRPSG